jgi:prepilin-type N-terminal cleavage/methylation domain-containing protein
MTAKIYKGFTLIELLIVIAILGVLAVVVLVAINPVQQLARTRDSGRISSVTQIGHAFEAFMASHNGEYPTTLQELVDTGDLSVIPAEVNNTLSILCTGNLQGRCFDVAGDNSAFVVWSSLEASTNRIICGAATDPAYAAYSSNTGKTCIVCAEPTNVMDINNCVN